MEEVALFGVISPEPWPLVNPPADLLPETGGTPVTMVGLGCVGAEGLRGNFNGPEAFDEGIE